MLCPCADPYIVPESPSAGLTVCPYSSAHSHRATWSPRTARIDNRPPRQLPVRAMLLLPALVFDFPSQPIVPCAYGLSPSAACAPPQRAAVRALLAPAVVRLSLLLCRSLS